MKLLLPLVSLAAIILVSAATASNPHNNAPITWGTAWNYRLLAMDTPEPPDGGMHAYNVTDCAWNDEDDIASSAIGTLDPGTETTATLCLVADLYGSPSDYPKYIYARVYTPKTNLKVWVTSDPTPLADGRIVPGMNLESQPPAPSGMTGKYANEYKFCAPDPVAVTAGIYSWTQFVGFWPYIDGSGGYGQIVPYTLHILNTSRQTQSVNAYFSIAWNDYDGTGPFISPTIQRMNGSVVRIPCP